MPGITLFMDGWHSLFYALMAVIIIPIAGHYYDKYKAKKDRNEGFE